MLLPDTLEDMTVIRGHTIIGKAIPRSDHDLAVNFCDQFQIGDPPFEIRSGEDLLEMFPDGLPDGLAGKAGDLLVGI